MQVLKQHIAVLFLAGFLFPQVLSSIHYLVVSHDFSSENHFAFTKPDPDPKFHSCVYHFTGFSSLLPSGNFSGISKHSASAKTSNFNGLENYVHEPDYNFQLRGPPLFSDL